MSLESQTRVTVRIDAPGLGNLGVFTKKAGGQADSEESKYPQGGMEAEESFGGRQTHDNTTVMRAFKRGRDLPLRRALLEARGKGYNMVIAVQALDEDKNPVDTPTVYVGTYKSFTMPDADSTSNDPAEFTLEQTTTGITA
jgi:hypothetical protein